MPEVNLQGGGNGGACQDGLGSSVMMDVVFALFVFSLLELLF